MLLPVLRPADWAHRSRAIHWPLWADPWAPIVTYAFDDGERLFGILRDSPDAARGVASLNEESLRNLASKPHAWTVAHEEGGRPIVLQLSGEYAAEQILLAAALEAAELQLGSAHLSIGVPDRAFLAVTVTGVRPQTFLDWISGLHAHSTASGAKPLFPFAILIQGRRPAGFAAPASKQGDLWKAPPPEEERLLQAVGLRADGLFEYSCYLPPGMSLPEEEVFALRFHTSKNGPACVTFMDEDMARRAAPAIWTTGARVLFMNERGEDEELLE